MNCGSPDEDPETSLARAYARWRAPLLRFLQRRLGNSSDAEDVAQESFTRLAAASTAPSPDKQGKAPTSTRLQSISCATKGEGAWARGMP
ncbi:RNA polymerase sigma factor [Variovorax sp. LjRoot175]